MKKALLVARDDDTANRFERNLRERGYDVVRVDSIESGRLRVKDGTSFDLVSIGGAEASWSDAKDGPLFRRIDLERPRSRGRFHGTRAA